VGGEAAGDWIGERGKCGAGEKVRGENGDGDMVVWRKPEWRMGSGGARILRRNLQ
jgi:hypothetical protein